MFARVSKTSRCVSLRHAKFSPQVKTAQVLRASYTNKPLPHNHYEFQTCVELQEKAVAMFGDKHALGTKNGSKFDWMTYKEFGGEIQKFKNVLASKGFKFDDKLAIISNNRAEWAVVMYSTVSLGGQLVPMYEAQLEKDWKYVIEDSDSKVLVVATDAIYQKVKDYVGKVGKVETVIVLDADESLPYSYKSLMKAAPSLPVAPTSDKVTPNHIAKIIYTSGTTGKPKGVELSHINITSNVYGLKEVMGECLVDHTSLAFLSWAHIFGMTVELHCLLSTGSRLAIVPHRDLILESLAISKPTTIYSVPTLFNKIYDGIQKNLATQSPLKQKVFNFALGLARSRNEKLEFGRPVSRLHEWEYQLVQKHIFSKVREKLGGNLRYMVAGGAATSVKVLQFFEDIGISICEGYGLTETSPVIANGTIGWTRRRIGTVGMPLPVVNVRIADPVTLEEMPADTDGEITCSGPSVMVGYRKNPDANAESFYEHGGERFFRTGDMGRMVEGKFLKITGRIKEQFKLENGKYVVPAPLEDALCRAPLVLQTFMMGANRLHTACLVVPDMIEVTAWVNANKDSTTKELVALLPTKEQLADKSIDTIPLFSHPVFTAAVSEQLTAAGVGLKGYERPGAWVAILHPFTPENQQLTPKLSLRRQNILAKYQPLLDKLYDKEVGVCMGKYAAK